MGLSVKVLLSSKYVCPSPFCCRLLYRRHMSIEASNNPWRSGNVPSQRELLVGKRPMTLQTGKLAKFADGCAIAKLEQTSVMVTVVGSKDERNVKYLPLTVDYRQKAAAAGRIPLNHFRREANWASEKEILTSRMIDRSIRPLFPDWYTGETQVACNLLAVDGVIDPEVLSINAASAAITLSDIPFQGPVGAVRVGYVDNEIVINPTRNELRQSQLDLIVSATQNEKVVMLESSAELLSGDILFDAITTGVKSAAHIAQTIEDLRDECGKPKRDQIVLPQCDENIVASFRSIAEPLIREVFSDSSHHKFSRDIAVQQIIKDTIGKIKEEFPEENLSLLHKEVNELNKKIFRELIFERNLRCDGRDLQDLRPISCEVDLFEPLHGSALFQRGQTQVLGTLAFDSPNAAAKADTITEIISGIKEKNFFLHYEFPPYAINDTGRPSTGRRELGHGALAEKGIRPVVPKDYPFTIRLTAEVLESNGSSSMASVCAGSLALMDAGVPVSGPVAGVAIGLVTKLDSEGEIQDYKLLTDLLGIEDYMGDMDFKIAGNGSGISALQADVKLKGLPLHIIQSAIHCGINGQERILAIMEKTLKEPRATRKSNGPILEELNIPANKHKHLLGYGGLNIKKLQSETGVTLFPHDTQSFRAFAPNKDAMEEAKERINEFLSEDAAPNLEFGAIYTVKIVEIREYGVMVQIHESMKPVLVHLNQLDQRKVGHPSALDLNVGQEINVKYFGRDPSSGHIRLSRKAIYNLASPVAKTVKKR